MPPAIAPAARLRADLDALSDVLRSATFRFSAGPGRAERRAAVVSSIEGYLLPRLGDPDGPVVVAVFGSTGSGKSTILNSIAGREVSRPGTLRPTTRAPVVLCHPENVTRMQRLREVGEIDLVQDDHPDLRRVSIVDTPDVDSVVESHRRQAEAILARSDAVIHVTTPQRYADAVPWEILRDVVRRDLPVLVVTNRLSRRSGGAVTDLASLLRSEGIASGVRPTDIVSIQEQRLKRDGRLPPSAVARVSAHVSDLAARHDEVVRRALRGTIEAVVAGARSVAADVAAQQEEIDALGAAVHLAVDQQGAELVDQLEQGDLVRTEVVERWRRLIGVSDLASIVTRGVGRLRDLVSPGGAVPADRIDQVEGEARRALIDLTLIRIRRVHEAVTVAWRLDPAGERLVDGDLLFPKEDRDAVGTVVDEWLASLVDLVEEQGQRRFRLARAASIGVNAAATTLLIGIFSATGGMTGAEVGVTAGAAAAQQTLLEHVFGGAAARRLAERARGDLAARMGGLISGEGARFLAALEAIGDPADLPDALDEAVGRVVDRAGEWFDG